MESWLVQALFGSKKRIRHHKRFLNPSPVDLISKLLTKDYPPHLLRRFGKCKLLLIWSHRCHSRLVDFLSRFQEEIVFIIYYVGSVMN